MRQKFASRLGLILCSLLLWGCFGLPEVPWEKGSLSFSHAPGFYPEAFSLKVETNAGGELYYSTNGQNPSPGSKHTFPLPESLDLSTLGSNDFYKIQTVPSDPEMAIFPWEDGYEMPVKGLCLTIARFEGDILLEKQVVSYVLDKQLAEKRSMGALFITVEPDAFFSDQEGIYVPGNFVNKEHPHRSGNYYRKGIDWERHCGLMFFEAEGGLAFESKAGVRIQGYNTPATPQKSLKFYAREEYGNTHFNYPFFGEQYVSSFNRIVLKSSFSGWKNGLFRNCFASEACGNLKVDAMHQRPVMVFLNGEFWGIEYLGEKDDEYFLENKYGYSRDSVSISQNNFIPQHGNAQSFKQLVHFVRDNDLAVDSNYRFFEEHLDVPGFIDYLSAEVFFGNADWPCNNILLWKHNDSLKWHSFLIDLDATMLFPVRNHFNRATETHLHNGELSGKRKCNLLIRGAMRHPGFRKVFKERMLVLLENDFSTNRLLKQLDNYSALHDPLIAAHSARWKYPTVEEYEKVKEEIRKWITARPDKVREELAVFLQKMEAQQQEEFLHLID